MQPDAGFILNKPTARWQKVWDRNPRSMMICGREAARQMIAEGYGGTIVSFASIAGLLLSDTQSSYSTGTTIGVDGGRH